MNPEHKKTVFISVILTAILGFVVYGNSLRGEFIYDDEALIKNNSFIKSRAGLPDIFTRNLDAGAGYNSNFYRPLQAIIYAAEYQVYKLDVRGYHLTSIILHILAACCIYWLSRILFQDQPLSLLTSLIFVVHPAHTQAVSYISGRADVLALLFTLLAFIFYLKILRRDNMVLYLLAVSAYALALLSKENSLLLPALLLLYHFSFRVKVKPRAFLPILSVTVIYALLRMTLLKSLLSGVIPPPTTLLQRLPGFFAAVTNYLRILLLPFGLHMEYGLPLFKFIHPQAVTGIIILAAGLFYIFRIRATKPFFFFAPAWFLLALLPQANLYPINAYMAENWLYLPSIGFFLLLSRGISYLYRRREVRITAIVSLTGLVSFYGYLTVRQNNYWKDPIAFYERTLRYAPDSPRIYNNLGKLYSDMGREEEAIALYKKAIELGPRLAGVYGNLGNSYKAMGENEEAVAAYKKAIALDPNLAGAYTNLGALYYSLGKHGESIAAYKKAIELSPNLAEAHYNLGNSYRAMGRNEEAVTAYKKAIEINPGLAGGYNNLGNFYRGIGRKEEAAVLYRKAIEIDPDCASAYYNLSILYFNEQQYELAVKYCGKATELGFKAAPEFLKLLAARRAAE